MAAAHLYNFTHEKAGMSKVDSSHVKAVVHDMSKGSEYYQNALKGGVRTERQVEEIKNQLQHANTGQRADAIKSVASATAALEATRDFTRVCAVVDLDMFFAAVEMRDDPSLKDKPMAVGGMGMISTANYAARKFGVRSAMPGFIAVKLCPTLVFVKPNYSKYVEVAKVVRSVFAKYDPAFRAASLDEAYLDLTDFCQQKLSALDSAASSRTAARSQNSAQPAHAAPAHSNIKCTSMVKGFHPPSHKEEGPLRAADLPTLDEAQHATGNNLEANWDTERDMIETIVAQMRAEIQDATKITASAGIGPNPMLAKIASDFNKPNGQYFVPFNREGVMRFMGSLPIRKIPFIGKVSEALLGQAFGVSNGAQLLAALPDIYMTLTENQRTFLHRSCLGIADTTRDETESHRRKSVSQERTFRDCSDVHQLRCKCREIATKVAAMMQKGDPARGTSWEFFGSSDDGIGWQDTAAKAEHDDAKAAKAADDTAPDEDGAQADAHSDDRADDDVPRVPYRGKTVTLKLKLSNFKVLSRQVALPRLTNDADTIAAAAIDLLNKEIAAHSAANGNSGITQGGHVPAAGAGPAGATTIKPALASLRPPPSSTSRPASSTGAALTLRLMGVRMSALVFDDEVENSPLVQFLNLQGSKGGVDSQAGRAGDTAPNHTANRSQAGDARKFQSRTGMHAFMVPAHMLPRVRQSSLASTSHSSSSDVIVLEDGDGDCDSASQSASGQTPLGPRKRNRPAAPDSAAESQELEEILDLTMSPPAKASNTKPGVPAAAPTRLQTGSSLPCPVGVAPSAWQALPVSVQKEVHSNMARQQQAKRPRRRDHSA